MSFIGFDVKASFARHPVSHLVKPGDITKKKKKLRKGYSVPLGYKRETDDAMGCQIFPFRDPPSPI